ncbi:MAG TPA: type IV pilus biogenesis/stability protein PilW [Casimicrobiaceae bacterium]|nr:type IV pilus biogenesis/stability protein PilW [Casimicrobiaceae bacterium]
MHLRSLLALIALVLVAGCATKSTTTEQALPAMQPRSTPPQPQQTSPHDRARIHTDLASGYYERGQMDVALDELKLSASLDPNYAQTYNIYGLVYAVMGEDRNAEQNFDRALQLAPNDSEIHHNWGWYLCQHKREREALGQFELAVRNPLYRTPEIALVNAGRCAMSINEMGVADGYFRRALAAQPGNALASYGLALIAYKEGRYEEARAWMKAVMQMTNPAPEALYLGMCIERKLRDSQAALSYVSQLRNRYPDAVETKAISPDGGCE